MPDPSKLALDAPAMRELGYRVIDLIVDHYESVRDKPVLRRSSRRELEARLREPIPEKGMPVERVLQKVREDVLSHIAHDDHPRFFAFIPGPSNFVSVMADALASGFNVFAGTWLEGAGPAVVELVTLDWLRQICGLPESAGGLFVSGGSAANLTALAVAREVRGGGRAGVVYGSDQTHSSIERALRVLGFEEENLRLLPSDGSFCLPIDGLARAVQADRRAGRTPLAVVANAGTTSTGAVDPLEDIARLCSDEDLWFHVDGAHGAAATVTDRGRTLLTGIERAHSLTLDPHKWLFQPFETGVLILREEMHLEKTFHVLPEYMKDAQPGEEEVNFCDRGIQLTRGLRALKLWMSLKVFGLESFRKAIERGMALAEHAERTLRKSASFEVVTPAQLGIVSFRYVEPGATAEALDALNKRIVSLLTEDGFALLSSTTLRGRTVLRLCTINPRTTEEDIEATLTRIESLQPRVVGGGAPTT